MENEIIGILIERGNALLSTPYEVVEFTKEPEEALVA